MKRYTLNLGQIADGYDHPHPERTASRSVGWDRMFQVWPNRAAMLKSCSMQQSAGTRNPWIPIQKPEHW